VPLTTQYLDDADRLANRIAVIDRGTVIAEGTSDELKARVGGEQLEVVLEDPAQAAAAAAALEPIAAEPPSIRDGTVVVALRERRGAIAEAVRRLDAAEVHLADLSLSRPTLDDVFLVLTGRAAERDEDEEADAADGGAP
jgi:ABC-2 type transport system ATP-binding protein